LVRPCQSSTIASLFSREIVMHALRTSRLLFRPVRSLRLLVVIVLAWGCRGEAPAPTPDVFLLTVDTLRADRLAAYGSRRSLTPRLDGLAAESLVFEHAYAPAPFTLPSVSSLHTGRHPLVTGVTSNLGVIPEVVPTLAERLKQAGWRTGAVVSNFALRRVTGLERGFDHYDDRFNQLERNRNQPERIARDTREAALTLLDAMMQAGEEGPVFLWVHFQDPHGPYTPPPGYREGLLEAARALPEGRRQLPVSRTVSGQGGIPSYQVLGREREVGFYRAGYDAEVAYTDEEIGALIDGIRERGRLDDAIVLFATDHGEGLGEDDYWFAHGENLSESLVRVPLMIRAPGLAPGRSGDLASLLDVLPTLLSWLGLELPPTDGRDLLVAAEAPPALLLSTLEGSNPTRFAIVSEGEKYLLSPSSAGDRERLHRLGDEARDRSQEAPEHVVALRAKLQALRDALPPMIGRERQSLSDVEKARLRALGYVTDP
jgi:arylsulfatase